MNLKFLLTILLGCSFLQADSKAFYRAVERDLQKIIRTSEKQTHIGVEVVSVKSNYRLFSHNGDQLFVPASNVKLFTAGAALSTLGPDFTFSTKLLHDGKLEEKSLRGNLYLQGSGDPTFTLAHLENLLLHLRLLQIETIEGDLIIDASAFDTTPEGPGWMLDDLHTSYCVPTNGLCINRNCLNLWVRPSELVATAPKVFAYPRTASIRIENGATTDENAGKISVERILDSKRNAILVKGIVGLGSAMQTFSVPLKDPHLYAGELLLSVLKKAGIACKGKLRVEKAPPTAQVFATRSSEPLLHIIANMMKNSDNLFADQLFKAIACQEFGLGSWQTGKQAILLHLERDAQLDISHMTLVDGSGLSRYNLATPRQITSYLVWATHSMPYAPEFLSCLPIGGYDGTLKNRFVNLYPKLRAKTGSMTGMQNLSGIIETADGEKLAFSILSDGKQSEVQSEICHYLAGLSRKSFK